MCRLIQVAVGVGIEFSLRVLTKFGAGEEVISIGIVIGVPSVFFIVMFASGMSFEYVSWS
jgi:hypothetical protein